MKFFVFLEKWIYFQNKNILFRYKNLLNDLFHNIFWLQKVYQKCITKVKKEPEPPYFRGIRAKIVLLKLANKISSLYFLVLALWFYLVLYVFYYPTSIGCTERCYQFVITSLLSIKDSRNILISVNYTINLYIFVTDLVDNHIIFPYRIFIICPKADPFG